MVGSVAYRPVAFALAALTVAVGCTGTPEQDGSTSIELGIEPYNVPSGAEMLRCQEMALPSDTDIDVDQIRWAFSEGSHHVHVYVSAGGETDAPEKTYDCFQAVDFEKWHLLVADEQEGLPWTLPEGVAMHVKARQSILIQTHYLNTSSATTAGLVAQGSVMLRVAKPGTVQKRMAAIFAQNRDIHVPPYESGRIEARCSLPGPGDIHAMIGHYHVHGKKFETWVDASGKEPRTVYESTGSDHPRLALYDDLHLGRHDRLGWSCEYNNTLAVPLSFGPLEATQEHCNLFAFYTLDQGDADFLPCVIPAKSPE